MAGVTTASVPHLIKAQVYSNQLKTQLLDELQGMKYVDMITDFPDGDTLNIPSISQMSVYNYAENMPVRYSGLDTGNFTFSITDYKAAATYITNKTLQDSWQAARVEAQFVPMQHRALMEAIEQRILAVGPEAQTTGNVNLINGGRHRFVASGPGNTLTVEDFARAAYALNKANVPSTNRIAIVDPSAAYTLSTLTNIVNVSNNPSFQGIINTGISSNMKFIRNIYGFDVYESNHLKRITVSETIDGVVSGTSAIANLFFSATSDVLPIVGLMRQYPKVDSEYNKDRQREEYVTTARYGFKLFRPENMVVILSANDQVYA